MRRAVDTAVWFPSTVRKTPKLYSLDGAYNWFLIFLLNWNSPRTQIGVVLCAIEGDCWEVIHARIGTAMASTGVRAFPADLAPNNTLTWPKSGSLPARERLQ